MFTPEQQAALDDAYWNTSRTLISIAEEFGLRAGKDVGPAATPLPAGLNCWRCGEPIAFRNRTERREGGRPCPTMRCRCGATQLTVPPKGALPDTAASILLPLGDRASTKDYGWIMQRGIEALAQCGLRWTGSWRYVPIGVAPAQILELLASLPERSVVVPSLHELATNDGDALGLFFHLMMGGWRVISAEEPWESIWRVREHVGSGWSRY
jgi:hypothetical protein